jgi:glyoxylase-like metal-dependent hydrolase (beta-lactamase superfamily II)
MIENLILGSLSTNCWIISLEKDAPAWQGLNAAAIVDPADDAVDINACLEKNNLYPRYILITHGHFDHIAALPDIVEFWRAKNAPLEIAVSQEDACYLGKEAYNFHHESMKACFGTSQFLDSLWKPMPEPDMLLHEGSTVGPFAVMHLPGHSAGSIAFHDKKNHYIVSGDTLFKDGVGRTDLPGGNWEQLNESLRRLMAMPPDTVVFPGHGPTTTIGRESGR